MFVGSLGFIWTTNDRYQERVSDAYTEQSLVEYKRDHLAAEVERLKDRGDALKQSPRENNRVVIEQYDQLASDYKGVRSAVELNCERLVATATKVTELEKYREKLNWIFGFVAFGGLVGLALAIAGFRLWYVRVQVPLDKQAAAAKNAAAASTKPPSPEP